MAPDERMGGLTGPPVGLTPLLQWELARPWRGGSASFAWWSFWLLGLVWLGTEA